jgi:hypothetical protein
MQLFAEGVLVHSSIELISNKYQNVEYAWNLRRFPKLNGMELNVVYSCCQMCLVILDHLSIYMANFIILRQGIFYFLGSRFSQQYIYHFLRCLWYSFSSDDIQFSCLHYNQIHWIKTCPAFKLSAKHNTSLIYFNFCVPFEKKSIFPCIHSLRFPNFEEGWWLLSFYLRIFYDKSGTAVFGNLQNPST